MADDLAMGAVQRGLDKRIWNNPKIFSTEKPWYYYVHAFTVDENATISVGEGQVNVRWICESVDGRIAISDCETGLGKLEGDIQIIADQLKTRLPLPEVGVSRDQMQTVWDAMVKRLLARDNGMEHANPSWWNP